MKEKFPDIQITARPTHWDVAKTADVTQTTLAANSDLAGIDMQSDSVQLAPVLSAVEQAGHKAKVGEDGHIVLVAIDGSPAALAAIRDKRLDATISQPLTELRQIQRGLLEARARWRDVLPRQDGSQLADRRIPRQSHGPASVGEGLRHKRRRPFALG
jgi:ribose transport system substrate-binding protein